MGIQEEDEHRRSSQEIPISTGSERIFPSPRSRIRRDFFPCWKLTSIRVPISMAATFDLELKQMDVKTMFLQGNLEE